MPRRKYSDTELARKYLRELLGDTKADHRLKLEAARLILAPESGPDYTALNSEVLEMAGLS